MAGGPRLPSTWIADFRRLYDFTEAGRADLHVPAAKFNRAMRIDTQLVHPLVILPGQPPAEANLAFRNLMRAKMVKLATGQQMVTFLKGKGLSPTKLTAGQIRNGDNGASLANLTKPQRDALVANTPLWFYILREAELNNGKLRGVGARIVCETFHRAMEGSQFSIVRDPTWTPTLGPNATTFRMVDLLLFAFEGKAALLNPLGNCARPARGTGAAAPRRRRRPRCGGSPPARGPRAPGCVRITRSARPSVGLLDARSRWRRPARPGSPRSGPARRGGRGRPCAGTAPTRPRPAAPAAAAGSSRRAGRSPCPDVPRMPIRSPTTADAVSAPPAPGPTSVISRIAWPRSITALNAPSTPASGCERCTSVGCTRRHDARVRAARLGDELDAVAELRGVRDVERLERVDAGVRHVVDRDARVEGDRREDGDLRRGVGAVHVLGGVGLGVAQLLRPRERRGVVLALVHGREDVVRRAVDDAEHAVDVARDHRLAQHLDDGDRGAHGGLEAQLHAVVLGRREQLLAVAGQQLLVGRDDRLAGLEQLQQVGAGRLDAAHDLGDDAHVGVVADGGDVVGQHAGRRAALARRGRGRARGAPRRAARRRARCRPCALAAGGRRREPTVP